MAISNPDPYCLFPRTPYLFSSLNVQKSMLKDKIRLAAFHDAILKAVRPGDVVIDLGTGTGILAIWAARAGASKIYAIEETDAATAAENVIRKNGLDDIITVIHANSSEVTLPERADVLIAELVGHFLFEEGIVEYIADIRDNWLKPGARIIPSQAQVYLAPLELGESFEEISFWKDWKDPDLSSLADLASNSAYVESFRPENQLSQPDRIMLVDFNLAERATLKAEGIFTMQRPGFIDALGGWFHLELFDGIIIETGPNAELTHWQQCVFPLKNPMPVSRGDRIAYHLEIGCFGPGAIWRWELRHLRGKNMNEVHELRITHPGHELLFFERF